VYAGEGHRQQAVFTLEESMALYRRTLGIRDLRSLTGLNILASIYMMVGNHPKARALYEEAIPIERELYPNDVELARTLGGLASLWMQEGAAAQALPIAEEALALALKTEGENSLDAALAYANIAEGYRITGRPDRAAPLFRKSRATYERLLGPEHPRVSSVLTQEGLMLLHEGKLGLAERSLERALEIVEKSCPECGYERSMAENDLALLRIQQRHYDEADRLLTDVLAIQERSQGLPGTEIAVTLHSLAAVRQKERRYEDADRLQRRAAVLMSTYR
jgi:tetratricopeptide (TPR) repeat protein